MKQVSWHIHYALHHPVITLINGTSNHLWFLPALLVSVSLISVLVLLGQRRLVLPIAAALYLIGMSCYTYEGTALGMHWPFGFTPRNGPFFACVLVAFGYWASQRQLKPRRSLAVVLVIAGYASNLAEEWFVKAFFGVSLEKTDYLFSCVVMSAGFLLLALADPELGSETFWPKLAPYTLGVFVAHMLIVRLTLPFKLWGDQVFSMWFWQPVYPVLVFLASVAVPAALMRHPATWQLVNTAVADDSVDRDRRRSS